MKKILYTIFGLLLGLGLTVYASTVLLTTGGGTGVTTYNKGDLLYASQSYSPSAPGIARLARLASGSFNQVLTVSNGLPSWQTPHYFNGLLANESGGAFSHITSISFSTSAFNFMSVGSGSTLALDYTNGPASRSIAQTITGQWAFNSAPLGFTVANSASISLNLEVGGYASSSFYLGSAFSSITTNCTSNRFLQWATTGLFSCSTPPFNANPIGVRESGSAFSNVSSLSFSNSAFNISASGNLATISLDYVNGPASRSIAQTISGRWTFSTNASLSSGNFGINSGKTIDTRLEVGGTASISGLTTFANSASISLNLEIAGYASASQLFIGQNKQVQFSSTIASLSIPFEDQKYVSSSLYLGSAFSSVTTNCNGTKFLQWLTTGTFGCATAPGSSSGITGIEVRANPGGAKLLNIASLSFDNSAFNVVASGSTDAQISIDYTNGPASRSIAQTITGQWAFNNTPTSFTTAGSISLSGNEVLTRPSLSNVTTDANNANQGLVLTNTTAATAGTPNQASPVLHLHGNGVTQLAVSQPTDWAIQNNSGSGPSAVSELDFDNSLNNAAYTQLFSIKSNGDVNVLSAAPAKLAVSGNIQVTGNIVPLTAPTKAFVTASHSDTDIDTAGTQAPIRQSINSVVVGADGLPFIAYASASANKSQLVGIKCGNTNCSSGNTITTLDTMGPTGGSDKVGNIAVSTDSNSFPIVAYASKSAGTNRIFVVKCNTVNCSSTTKTALAQAAPVTNYVPYVAATLASDDFFIIAYASISGITQKVVEVKCGSATCATNNTSTVVNTGGVQSFGAHIQVTIGADGLPIMIYNNSATAAQVVHCGNSKCTINNKTSSLTTVADRDPISMKIGLDGSPFILAENSATGNDDLIFCGDTACANTNTTITAGIVTSSASMEIGNNGYPVIALRGSTTSQVRIVRCQNNLCTTTTNSDVSFQPNAGSGALQSYGIAIGSDGLPFVTYYAGNDVGVTHCSSQTCGTSIPTYTGSNIGSLTVPFQNIFSTKLWSKEFQIARFDLAESYKVSDKSIEAGDIVSLADSEMVAKSTTAYDDKLMGIVSTKPGITLSDWNTPDDSRPIALAGRVPVKVNMENGAIKAGDMITSSSVAGIGMKATQAGRVIGMALDSSNKDGLVNVLVNPHWYGGDNQYGIMKLIQDLVIKISEIVTKITGLDKRETLLEQQVKQLQLEVKHLQHGKR